MNTRLPTRLITIGPSHYCEKARWALDHAGIAFVEDAHLPLAHRFYTRRLGRQVPILVHDGVVYSDSTKILRFAHARASEPLYDKEGLALALERKLGDTLGPLARRLAYCYIAADHALFRRVFETAAPAREARLLRAGAPLFAKALGRIFRVSPRAAERCYCELLQIFDDIASRLEQNGGDRGYLVGTQFSAADLTFASLAQPLLASTPALRLDVRPVAAGTEIPLEEFPAGFREKIEVFSAHPAGRYAARMIAAHR
jgi:glutathione S-transferase